MRAKSIKQLCGAVFFLSPDTRGTFDSADDQLSIGCGHHYCGENKSDN